MIEYKTYIILYIEIDGNRFNISQYYVYFFKIRLYYEIMIFAFVLFTMF